jgi:hypothetical protein
MPVASVLALVLTSRPACLLVGPYLVGLVGRLVGPGWHQAVQSVLASGKGRAGEERLVGLLWKLSRTCDDQGPTSHNSETCRLH